MNCLVAGGRPSVGGRPGARAPWAPLNPALHEIMHDIWNTIFYQIIGLQCKLRPL